VNDGSLLQTLEIQADADSVAFAPDGQTIASKSSDTVKLWRVSDGTLLHTLEGHTDNVLDVAFATDGQTLASGSTDRTVKLWRVER
jgi:WD40 repeat protein